MLNFHDAELPANVVNALFEDKTISFSLLDGSTFADLADSLDRLIKRGTGAPTAVYMTLGATGAPASLLLSGI
jgi:hypothetical protein